MTNLNTFPSLKNLKKFKNTFHIAMYKTDYKDLL